MILRAWRVKRFPRGFPQEALSDTMGVTCVIYKHRASVHGGLSIVRSARAAHDQHTRTAQRCRQVVFGHGIHVYIYLRQCV